MKRLLIAYLLLTTQLVSLEQKPWLGNWLEFVGSLSQTHAQARSVDTENGEKHIYLHREETKASCEFMPFVNFSAALEADLTKTQKEEYGFDALRAFGRYRLLDDLTGDPVTLTAGLVAALSTPARVKDLSSTQHGVFEIEASASFGREFFVHETSFYNAWALVKAGAASSGSPWIGFEAHLGRMIHDTHAFDLFFRFERGLSRHKLHHVSDFHSYSRLGYEFEEVGARYTLKEVGLGSLYLEATTRLHARYAPKSLWSVQLGVVIPFSPW